MGMRDGGRGLVMLTTPADMISIVPPKKARSDGLSGTLQDWGQQCFLERWLMTASVDI